MRHGKKVNHLGRKTAHRKAMLANMACSLIEHKRINTTVAKAKALKVFIEPLITKSKAANNQTVEKGTHNRRIVFKNLRDKYAITELFSNVADKVGDRPGGYTRIIKLGNRLGDNAEMAMIELVDFNETYAAAAPKANKTSRRSRRKKVEDARVEEARKVEEAKSGKETKTKQKAEKQPVDETKPDEAEDTAEAKTEEKTDEGTEK